jgi:hypothetical protein
MLVAEIIVRRWRQHAGRLKWRLNSAGAPRLVAAGEPGDSLDLAVWPVFEALSRGVRYTVRSGSPIPFPVPAHPMPVPTLVLDYAKKR